jgi:hypothetical protein
MHGIPQPSSSNQLLRGSHYTQTSFILRHSIEPCQTRRFIAGLRSMPGPLGVRPSASKKGVETMLCDPYEEPQPRKEPGVLGTVSGLLRVSCCLQRVLSWRWLGCVMPVMRPCATCCHNINSHGCQLPAGHRCRRDALGHHVLRRSCSCQAQDDS